MLNRKAACLWLSGAKQGTADAFGVETDTTLDQVLAAKLSEGARQKSLELSCNAVGNLMHALFVSWSGRGVPQGAETDPRDVFTRMFGDAGEDRRRQNILDVVAEDARRLKSNLGQGDQRRLDEYLESVRALERQMAAFSQGKRPVPQMTRPERTPPTLRDFVTLMTDLVVVALQTDFTRVITFTPGDESEGTGTTYARTLADFGIDKKPFSDKVDAKYLSFGHHACSHDPKPTLPLIQAMDRWYVDRLLYLLQKMQAVPEGEGSLLDNSIVVYGNNNSSGTTYGWPGHSLKDVSCLLAGKGGGLLKPGRQVRYKEGTPLSNLWLTLAQRAGVDRKEFGRSTGTLTDLG